MLEILKNIPVLDSVKDLVVSGDWQDEAPIFIDPATHTTPDGQSGWGFDSLDGDFKYFKYTGFSSCVTAYERCPPVSGIINRKTQSFINGDTWILNEDNKVSTSPQAMKLKKLIDTPNVIQNWVSFESQMYTYFQTFGFAIILPIIPFGYEKKNINATSLWNIPANWIDVKATEENFTKNGGVSLQEIIINFNNTKIVLNISDLIIIKDITPSFSSITFPVSKLLGLQEPINNIIGAYESRGVLINNRGALGILTQDPGRGQFMATPMTKVQKEELQRDFRRYGLKKKQFQVILTTASLKWQQMGYATRDLMLMEEVEESSKACCVNLNFPAFMLGLKDSTFNNMNEARKDLYDNATVPDAKNIYNQLTGAFGLIEFKIRLDKDFSKVPALQKNKKEEAEARTALDNACKLEFEAGLITLDEWLAELGKDPLPGGIGKVRATDPKDSNVPLVTIIGVGGIEGLIEVVSAPTLSPEARQAILEIVFGISPADAARMSISKPVENETQQGQQGQSGTGNAQAAA